MEAPHVFSAQGAAQLPVVVVGAGIGGLSAALWLASAGLRVVVLERHDWVGGKARSLPSFAGPVAAGPTVLTLRHVFDDLFTTSGAALEDCVTLTEQPVLARHFWPDGSQLDLMADPQASADNIAAFSGPESAQEFRRFHAETLALFEAFDGPMMRASEPSQRDLALTVARRPGLLRAMAPHRTLAQHLARRFSDPRLAQLFGRYATYVGGSPIKAPALLSLIWQAEARGVWTVRGGISALASAMRERIESLGGEVRTGVAVTEIAPRAVSGIEIRCANRDRLAGRAVVFNGDPRALSTGTLGGWLAEAHPRLRTARRSLSARVWSFAAHAKGRDLAHHNVFFSDNPQREFEDLAQGVMPSDPTIYLCAQDRGSGQAPREIDAAERFEIILNAPPLDEAVPTPKEGATCHQRTFPRLEKMGLTFAPSPDLSPAHLTTPDGFEALFPNSLGSLYGQSPHGLTASLSRPRARAGLPGVYLCGGGTHPGAGVPMAALSGRHAAEAILTDLALPLPSRPTATPGGISTGSAMTARARSR